MDYKTLYNESITNKEEFWTSGKNCFYLEPGDFRQKQSSVHRW